MRKRNLVAAGIAGLLLAAVAGLAAPPAEARTDVHLYFGVNVGPMWPGYYPGPVYVPPYYYAPPRHYRVRYYTPRWRWRCRVRTKRVRFWHRRHGHWHYKTVRRRVCHRVRVW